MYHQGWSEESMKHHQEWVHQKTAPTIQYYRTKRYRAQENKSSMITQGEMEILETLIETQLTHLFDCL